jgi:hypothetical protein
MTARSASAFSPHWCFFFISALLRQLSVHLRYELDAFFSSPFYLRFSERYDCILADSFTRCDWSNERAFVLALARLSSSRLVVDYLF